MSQTLDVAQSLFLYRLTYLPDNLKNCPFNTFWRYILFRDRISLINYIQCRSFFLGPLNRYASALFRLIPVAVKLPADPLYSTFPIYQQASVVLQGDVRERRIQMPLIFPPHSSNVPISSCSKSMCPLWPLSWRKYLKLCGTFKVQCD